MAVACIAIGSNLGDRGRSLDRAVAALGRLAGVRVAARSGNIETAPEGGPPGQGAFLNGAVVVQTDLSPQALLAAMQRIEADLGRPPPADRVVDGPRTIDLDLLLYDRLILDTPALTLPHPRMHRRRFVLAPLAEVAPDAVHPRLGRTVAELLERLETGRPDGP